MITFKQNGISKKEESMVLDLLNNINDPFSDFYITKNNMRLFIRENYFILKDALKKGDKIAFDSNGIAVVVGFSDQAPRKYLKVLTKDPQYIRKLIKTIYWNVKEDIFCKIKNNNPLKDILTKCGFKIIGNRGKEVLLVHKYRPIAEPTRRFVKDVDEED